MKGWILFGAVGGMLCILAYAIVCVRAKEKLELSQALNVFLGGAGVVASVRMLGSTVFGDLAAQITAPKEPTIWALTGDDGLFIFIGALAMGWVSVQTAYAGMTSGRFRSGQDHKSAAQATLPQ